MAQPRAQARVRRRHRRRAAGTGSPPRITSPRSTASRNVAVLEKGWIGGGNTGRNTTIVRSNYLWDEATHLYEKSMKLWEGLSQDLNYNVMFSQRGVLNLGHTLQDMRDIERRVNANRLNGVDGEVLTRAQVKAMVPIINTSPNARYPMLGASLQRRGGHRAPRRGRVGLRARAPMRAASTSSRTAKSPASAATARRCRAWRRAAGFIKAKKVGVVAAGHSSVIAAMADLRLPIESHPLQALVSEPIKPVLAHRRDVERRARLRQPVRQGRPRDRRGHRLLHRLRAARQLLRSSRARWRRSSSSFPTFSRVRMNRQWGGIVDVCPDACPIIGKTPVKGLYFNCGWGTGGFKATPGLRLGVRAHDRAGPAARAQRGVLARPLLQRPPDRRARRGRRRALTDARSAPMLLIDCPWCGPREQTEFSCGGEAHIVRPVDTDALTDEQWGDYLFMRKNPRGPHLEQWVHSARLPAVVQRRARHRHLPDHGGLQARSASEAGRAAKAVAAQ